MEILLLRHGKTKGNVERRYVGRTDEPLLKNETERLRASNAAFFIAENPHMGSVTGEEAAAKETDRPAAANGDSERIAASVFRPERIYVSPMLRCRQTAEAVFFEKDGQETEAPALIIKDGLRETDFGSFEYHNYEELNGRPDYQAWIDSGGLSDYPGGEPGHAFRERTRQAFYACLIDAVEADAERIAIVCHGGVIMSVLSGIMGEETFYEWQIKNGNGFFLHWDLKKKKNKLQWVGVPSIQKAFLKD